METYQKINGADFQITKLPTNLQEALAACVTNWEFIAKILREEVLLGKMDSAYLSSITPFKTHVLDRMGVGYITNHCFLCSLYIATMEHHCAACNDLMRWIDNPGPEDLMHTCTNDETAYGRVLYCFDSKDYEGAAKWADIIALKAKTALRRPESDFHFIEWGIRKAEERYKADLRENAERSKKICDE